MPTSGRRSKWFACAALLAFGVGYAWLFLGLPSGWWFEEDPIQFDYASQLHGPVAPLVTPAVIRGFAGGRSLVPLQLLSYWIDTRAFGTSPAGAYGHQFVAVLVAMTALFWCLVRALDFSPVQAAVTSALWSLLPASYVVFRFLATRHYLEGFALAAAAIGVYGKPSRSPRAQAVLALALAALAMLSKEIYVAVVPLALVSMALARRAYQFAFAILGLVGAYAGYRAWMLGDYNSDMPLLAPWTFVRFLTKFPYTVSATYGGFVILSGAIVLLAWAARRGNARVALLFGALLAASVAAVAPVAFPLYGMIKTPDPWYRITFAFNTLILIGGAWAALRCLARRTLAALTLAAFALVAPGTVKTDRWWKDATTAAQREARFYLDNPDKVLLSRQAAYWFIPGVHLMYRVPSPHYLLEKDFASSPPPPPFWSLVGDKFVETARPPSNPTAR